MTPQLSEYQQCRFWDCDQQADEIVEHPDEGEICVCATCARLFQ